jgi:cobalt-zinc-cadmium efflux system outer membrane protein
MRQTFLIGVLLCAGVPLAWAGDLPNHPLTLKEALELVRARNPLLLAARQHLQAVQANEVTAGLRPNPVLTSANEDFNVFNPNQFNIANRQEFTDNVSQLIERGHKRQLRVEDARAATQVARDSYRDAERQLELAVKTSFVAMLLAKSNLQLAQENLQDYKETVRLNEIRLKAGDISPTDFDRIKIEQVRFENDLLNAQLSLDQARVQLESLLGYTALPEKFDVQGELVAPELAYTLAELGEKGMANRPDYMAARDSVIKAQNDVRLADANGATDVAVGGEYKRNGPDNTLGFTIAFPLRFFDRNQGEKLRTRHDLDASRSAEVAARTTVLADVAQAYQAYHSAMRLAQLYSQDYLQRARDVRNHIEFSFRNGGASLLDYLDAVRSYREVELAARSARAQAMLAVHQLSFATGTELLP